MGLIAHMEAGAREDYHSTLVTGVPQGRYGSAKLPDLKPITPPELRKIQEALGLAVDFFA